MTTRFALGVKGLHHARGANGFCCIGGCVCEAILRQACAPPDRAARSDKWQHDDGNGHQHQAGQMRACINHQGDSADEQNKISECNGGGRAEG